ncbi:hypothetical protein CTM62_06690 [Prevotella intermedia]|uniref:Uncharacterized protein n=1 Tax=Prevotella intermedia TaxID=28131 RepID=A0A2D3L777_PREIN|nr:hypothetical protein CTM62_06690 [Prevotella intermedia]
MALRKRNFCRLKEPLLPCKTYAFRMQNNRFCKPLAMKWLNNRHACEKYLHLISVFPVNIIRCIYTLAFS